MNNVWGLIVEILVPTTYPGCIIGSDDGVNYGPAKIADNKRWKLGDDGSKFALGYYTDYKLVHEILQLLNNDSDVVQGRVRVSIVEYDISVIDRYQSVQIDLDTFYMEGCINADSTMKITSHEVVHFLQGH
jgi:hypothetical protein